MNAIKLYAKDVILGKAETYKEAQKTISEIYKTEIILPQKQEWKQTIKARIDLKKYKFEFCCEYYSIDTIKQMQEDKK
jgi:hypothetical protein